MLSCRQLTGACPGCNAGCVDQSQNLNVYLSANTSFLVGNNLCAGNVTFKNVGDTQLLFCPVGLATRYLTVWVNTTETTRNNYYISLQEVTALWDGERVVLAATHRLTAEPGATWLPGGIWLACWQYVSPLPLRQLIKGVRATGSPPLSVAPGSGDSMISLCTPRACCSIAMPATTATGV